MTLKGIDVSSWQRDIDLVSLPVDFVIIKATEDTTFVDSYCDKNVQQCIKSGKLWGFYHFAGTKSADKEADFFVENCKNYFKHGIPILDWEGQQSLTWVNAFVRRVHDKTGVWCWIYANPYRFNQGVIEPNCARWVASYPSTPNPTHNQALDWECPEATGNVVAWQFCSDGRLKGYSGDLDMDLFYGDAKAWNSYANPESIKESKAVDKEPDGKKGTSFTVEDSVYRITVEKK